VANGPAGWVPAKRKHNKNKEIRKIQAISVPFAHINSPYTDLTQYKLGTQYQFPNFLNFPWKNPRKF